MIILRIYEVPDESHPNINKLAIVYSNVNSSVCPFIPNKNTPTQKPMHMGHRNKSPSFPLDGLIELRIVPYTNIWVNP